MKLTRKEALVILALAIVGAITLAGWVKDLAVYMYNSGEEYNTYMNNRSY